MSTTTNRRVFFRDGTQEDFEVLLDYSRPSSLDVSHRVILKAEKATGKLVDYLSRDSTVLGSPSNANCITREAVMFSMAICTGDDAAFVPFRSIGPTNPVGEKIELPPPGAPKLL